MKPLRILVWLISISVATSLSACSSISGLLASPTPTSTDTPTVTATFTPTYTPSFTPTPLPTDTPTPTPPPTDTQTPVPSDTPEPGSPTPGPPVGTDFTQELPPGDAARGEALAVSAECADCHIPQPGDPDFGQGFMSNESRTNPADRPAVAIRAAERITEAGYTGQATSDIQYLFESIVDPKVFIVAGTSPDFEMEDDYAERLTLQDVADLIAYLMTFE